MPIEVVSQQASTVDDILKREVAILKPNAGRCGNLIKTSRFNLLSFVPITLYELLHPWKRFANFYFLCVGAMQMVPVITKALNDITAKIKSGEISNSMGVDMALGQAMSGGP